MIAVGTFAVYRGMTGGINIAFRNLIAQLYSQDLSEKVRSARDTLNRHGKSSAPYGFYGYIIDPQDRHKLVIDEPAAEVVRTIYNLYEQGMSLCDICTKQLDDYHGRILKISPDTGEITQLSEIPQ